MRSFSRMDMLSVAAMKVYDGFPLLGALETHQRIELARSAEIEPYIESFRTYIKTSYPRFPFTKHTERLIDIAQRVADGDLPRLMVELPPRHWKSTIFSRFLPGYCMRRFPDRSAGICCHTQDLATGFSENARDYFVASGGVLRASLRGKEEWGPDDGIGSCWTAGVGKGTGKPGHFLFVDDPIKSREQAESAAYRRQIHSWWDSVLSTREEPGSSMVIVHTRWHEYDLIGYLLEKNLELEKEGLETECERWHVISLPIEALPANDIKPLPSSVTREVDSRKVGEPLDPDRFGHKFIKRKRANTPPRDWEAIYQQRPSAGAGTVFFKDRLAFYSCDQWKGLEGDPMLPQQFIRKILSVDCTFDDTAGSDMVAMGLYGQTEHGLWKIDLINERLDFPKTLNMIKTLYKKHYFNELLIEKKANGAGIIKMLESEQTHGFRVVAAGIGEMGSKEGRANAASVEVNSGRVLLPRSAPWTNECVDQLTKFPSGVYYDIVDEVSQVVIYVTGSGPLKFETVSWGYGVPGFRNQGAMMNQVGYNYGAMNGAQSGVFGR